MSDIRDKIKRHEQLAKKLHKEYREKVRRAEVNVAFTFYRAVLNNDVSLSILEAVKEYLNKLDETKKQRFISSLKLLHNDTGNENLKQLLNLL